MQYTGGQEKFIASSFSKGVKVQDPKERERESLAL